MMATNKNTCLCYAIDQTPLYRQMALRSAWTARSHDPETEIVFVTTGPWRSPLPYALQPARIIEVQPPFRAFPANMCVVAQLSSFENVIYIDSDTFLFGDPRKLLGELAVPFSARLSTRYQHRDSWSREFDDVWRRNLARIEAPYGPVYNIGLMVFQSGSHLLLADLWQRLIQGYERNEFEPVYGGAYLHPQMALSMAVATMKWPVSLLNDRDHAFAWANESRRHAIVYHTNSQLYDSVWRTLRKELAFPLHFMSSTE